VVNLAADSSRLPARGQHVGTIQVEAPNARTPVTTIQAVVTVDLPYLLDPADRTSAIRDKDELWRWCDVHWPAAGERLAAGRLAACLRFIGETALTQEAVRCRGLPDRNAGLETLLRACGAPPPRKYDTNALDIEGDLGYGFLPRLGKKPDVLTFKILNKSARGYLHGRLEGVAPWLSIPQPAFGCLPGEMAEVQIHADHKARPRKLFSAGEQLFDIVIE
jgi:hypothetical protein